MASIEVLPLFVGKRYRTEMWASEEVLAAIESECEKPASCMKKLAVFSEAGFLRYEGKRGVAIVHEIGKAYRIRYQDESLFRLIGFYTSENKKEFIVLDAFLKSGNRDKYPPHQWRRIEQVAEWAETLNSWHKRDPNVNAGKTQDATS